MRIIATDWDDVTAGDVVAGLGLVKKVEKHTIKEESLDAKGDLQVEGYTRVKLFGPNESIEGYKGNVVGVVDENDEDLTDVFRDWWDGAMTRCIADGQDYTVWRIERYVIAPDGERYDVENFAADTVNRATAQVPDDCRPFVELHLPIDQMPGPVRNRIPGWPS